MVNLATSKGSLFEKLRAAWRGIRVEWGNKDPDDELLKDLKKGWEEGRSPLPTAALIYGLMDIHRFSSQKDDEPSILGLIYRDNLNKAIFARPEVFDLVVKRYRADHRRRSWQFDVWEAYAKLSITLHRLDNALDQFGVDDIEKVAREEVAAARSSQDSAERKLKDAEAYVLQVTGKAANLGAQLNLLSAERRSGRPVPDKLADARREYLQAKDQLGKAQKERDNAQRNFNDKKNESQQIEEKWTSGRKRIMSLMKTLNDDICRVKDLADKRAAQLPSGAEKTQWSWLRAFYSRLIGAFGDGESSDPPDGSVAGTETQLPEGNRFVVHFVAAMKVLNKVGGGSLAQTKLGCEKKIDELSEGRLLSPEKQLLTLLCRHRSHRLKPLTGGAK